MKEIWFLRNFINIKKNFCSQFKNKKKINIVLDCVIYVSFIFLFASVPICSFNSSLFVITWLFTGITLICMFLDCLFYYGFRLDAIVIGLILFCLCCVLSSAVNGFQNFVITPIALMICSSVIYIYTKQNNSSIKYFMLCCLIGDLIFLFSFIFTYRNELFSLNFDRLGGMFGDENDIALFLLFGFSISSYYALFKNKVFFKVVSIIIAFLFLFCAISCGSKICIFMVAAILTTLFFMFFGKKRWYLALIVSLIAITSGILIIWFVPAFGAIKFRFISFLNEIFNSNIPGGTIIDTGTSFRFNMFLTGIDLWLRRPFIGWGVQGFATFSGIGNGWSHNNISETLCNFGILGTVFFHLGFVYSFLGYKKQKNCNLNIYLLILIFFIVSMIEVALNSQKIYALTIPIVFSGLCVNPQFIGFKKMHLQILEKNDKKC